MSRLPSAGVSGKTGAAVGAIAIVCCAALPTVAAAVGGLSLAALLGAGAGIVVVVGALSLAGVLLLNARRRRKKVPGRGRTEAAMTVEMLYSDGCPSHDALLPRLKAVLRAEGVTAPVELRRIESVEAAERTRFLGSPTVRIEGADIDPSASGRVDFGLKCRLYDVGGSFSPMPPDEWIRAALRGGSIR